MLMWIIIGVVAGGVLFLRLFGSFYQKEDLGAVSGQWLAEYRQDHES
jgi:hypothetical protein